MEFETDPASAGEEEYHSVHVTESDGNAADDPINLKYVDFTEEYGYDEIQILFGNEEKD